MSIFESRLGSFDLKEFKMTSRSKDWSDTVQVDDVSTSNGGTGGCNKYDVSSLLADAPLDSIRQKINVEREEEVVEGPLAASDEALLNTDVVSEKVDLDLTGGQVQVTVCVRCERTVPLYSMDSVYKKSSVIVTRRVSIDMECTEIRRQLYATLQRRQCEPSSDDKRLRLSAKETFQLYKGFMGLVEANETARSNVLKPQPGSILGDDIEIFKKPSSRSYVNGSSSSSRHVNNSSSDDYRASAEPTSPFGGGISSFSRDSVVRTTPPLSDTLENGLSSAYRAQGQTPYSSRLTSWLDSTAQFSSGTTSFKTSPDQGIGSESEMNNDLAYGATSPYSSLTRPHARYDDIASRSTYGEDSSVPSKYSSRFSSLSRDRGESGSDYSSTRMSAYDKYRSRSPYVKEDRVTLSSSDRGESGSDFSSTRRSAYDKYRSKSPYVADDRVTSAYDRGESGGDYSSTRSSVYDKYISRSPYAADDRASSSPYTSSILATSRNSSTDLNSNASDAAGRPTSRYERILSSRTRSPYRTEDSTTPYLTRAISIDDENNPYRSESSDYYSSAVRPTSSRYAELDGKSPFTTTSEEIRSSLYMNGNGETSYGLTAGDVTGLDADSSARSTLLSRFGRSPLTSQDGGSSSSYLSRYTSRLAGSGESDSNAASEVSWAKRNGGHDNGSGVSNTGAAEESSAPLANGHAAASSWHDWKQERDSQTAVRVPPLQADNLRSSAEFSNGCDVESGQANGPSDAAEHVQQFTTKTLPEGQTNRLANRMSQDSSDSSHSSPRGDLSSSRRRTMRSDWTSNDSSEVRKSSSPRIEREKTSDSLTSSDVNRVPVSSLTHDDDTWTPVADAISAAMTSLTCANSAGSQEPDAGVTSVTETLVSSRTETPVGRPDIGSQLPVDFDATAEGTNSAYTIDVTSDMTSSMPRRERRQSTSSTSSLSSSRSGLGSLSSLMRPTAASSARRNSASASASTSSGSGRVPSYAAPTSSSASKTSATPGASTATISRTKSSPALRDATVIVKPTSSRTPATSGGPSSQQTSSRSSSSASGGRAGTTSGASLERRGSASLSTAASKDATPSSTSRPPTASSSSVRSDNRRSRTTSGSSTAENRASASTAATTPAAAPRRPVSINRTTTSSASTSSGRRTPTAAPPASPATHGAGRTTPTSARAADGPQPATPTSKPPPGATPSRPVNPSRPYRSRNSAMS